MDNAVLLAQLQSLLENAPDFSIYSPSSKAHHTWLAKAHALIKRWQNMEAIGFASAIDTLHLSVFKDGSIAKIFGLIHRAIADIELEAPRLTGQGFVPGEVYDFFKALSTLIGSATKSVFIVDQYLDEQIFDTYLAGLPTGISVRLLAYQYGKLLKPAVQKFSQQYGANIDIKTNKELHDRIVIVDELSCWVIGQSIKDAAKNKDTYLLPLLPDIAKQKLAHYEVIWSTSLAL